MIDSKARPHEAAKYDGDHKWSRWWATRIAAAATRHL